MPQTLQTKAAAALLSLLTVPSFIGCDSSPNKLVDPTTISAPDELGRIQFGKEISSQIAKDFEIGRKNMSRLSKDVELRDGTTIAEATKIVDGTIHNLRSLQTATIADLEKSYELLVMSSHFIEQSEKDLAEGVFDAISDAAKLEDSSEVREFQKLVGRLEDDAEHMQASTFQADLRNHLSKVRTLWTEKF